MAEGAQVRQRWEDGVRAAGWALVRAAQRPSKRTHRSADSGPDLAVLVHSFDGYKRFWKPAAYFIDAGLPKAIPRYFASEVEPFRDDGFEPILTGVGSFGDRMNRLATSLIDRRIRYVLYLQEDMWLSDPVSISELDLALDLMRAFDLDSLKLAHQFNAPPRVDVLGRECSWLGDQGLASRVHWYGCQDYVFSHHTTIFRTSFLKEVATAASLFRRVKPLQQEQFCSAYLKRRTVATDGDGARYRIATFSDEPLLSYVHASEKGQITAEASAMLEERGLVHLYDPDLPGEVFPWNRSEIE